MSPQTEVLNELLVDVLSRRERLLDRLCRARTAGGQWQAQKIERAISDLEGTIALLTRGHTLH